MNQKRYSTTIEQDQQFLAQINQIEAVSPLEGSDRRRKMAIQVRLGEKEILEAVKAKINDHFTNGSTSKRIADSDSDDLRRTKVQRI